MSERVFDYSNFPDASAPRRFEVLNAENTVCGYGVEMSSGFCLAEQPDSPDQSEWRVGFASIADVQRQLTIRWIDPPFKRDEEGHL